MDFRDIARDLRAVADERDRTPRNGIPEIERLASLAGRRYAHLCERGALGFSKHRMGLEVLEKMLPDLFDFVKGNKSTVYWHAFSSVTSNLVHLWPDRFGDRLTYGGTEPVVVSETEISRQLSAEFNPERWRDRARCDAAICDFLARWEDAAMADERGPQDPRVVDEVAKTFREEAELFGGDPVAALKDDRTGYLVGLLDRLADTTSLPRPLRKRLPTDSLFGSGVDAEVRWQSLVAGLVQDFPLRFHNADAELGWQTFDADGPTRWTRHGKRMPEGWDPQREGGGFRPGDSGERGVVNTTCDGMSGADWKRYAQKLCLLYRKASEVIAEMLESAVQASAEKAKPTVGPEGLASEPTLRELCDSVGISYDTFARIRKDAGIEIAEKGGAASKRRYSPSEVDAMIAAAVDRQRSEHRRIAATWNKWGSTPS